MIKGDTTKLKLFLFTCILFFPFMLRSQQPVPAKPRILISTDIGGTDPDDNQSMIHFLMYSNMFHTEGLISSPSYGKGSKQDILEMINLYAHDLPKLQQHTEGYPSPDTLRAICKQGSENLAPFAGYSHSTEGSSWIIKCAHKKSKHPLWVLVWGGLADLAQALHDDPSIQHHIKVYWIGGPNKKWSANSYAYIVKSFPDLWFIENNASYRGFFLDKVAPDNLKNDHYYTQYIRKSGYLGKGFKHYYNGHIKMGDTPSLLFLMDGDPNDPLKESWGGSFMPIKRSSRIVFNRTTTLADTVPVYSMVEIHLKGPEMNRPKDSSCFTLIVNSGAGIQKWAGYYRGNGNYAVRYVPKKAEVLNYKIISEIPGFTKAKGQLVVKGHWPGKNRQSDYILGGHWYTDKKDQELFINQWQGAETVQKWRKTVLTDWAKRWEWLRH